MHRRLIIAVLSLLLIDGRTFAEQIQSPLKERPGTMVNMPMQASHLITAASGSKPPSCSGASVPIFVMARMRPQLQMPDLDRLYGYTSHKQPSLT